MLQARGINSETFTLHQLLACEHLDAEIKFLHNLLFVRVDHATLCPRLAQDSNRDDPGQTLFALQASRKVSYGPGRLGTFHHSGKALNGRESVLTQFLCLKGLSGVVWPSHLKISWCGAIVPSTRSRSPQTAWILMVEEEIRNPRGLVQQWI